MDLMEHEGLVYAVVNKYFKNNPERDDLVQEGFVGLVRARNTWDRQRNFSTYAYRCIMNEILQYLRKNKRRSHEVLFSDISDITINNLMTGDIGAIMNDNILSKYGDVADLLVKGYKQSEIAEMKGVSRQWIAVKVKKIREMVKG